MGGRGLACRCAACSKLRAAVKDGMEMATDYVKGIPERNVEDTTFMVIKQGKEPPNFTMHFGGWDFRGGEVGEPPALRLG